MTLRHCILVIAFLVVSVETRLGGVAAECIRLSGNQLLREDRYEFVFDGTAVDQTWLSAQLVGSTVQVHRVWKGPVPQRLVVYARGYAESNAALERGTRYVIAAFRETPHDLPSGGVFIHSCGAVPYRYAGELLSELGRGRLPLR